MLNEFKTGVVPVEEANYHSSPGANWSKCKEFRKGVPDDVALAKISRDISHLPAVSYGSAIHMAILEPFKFSNKLAIWPNLKNLKTKDNADFRDFHSKCCSEGLLAVTKEELSSLKAFQKKASEHDILSTLLESPDGLIEQAAYWLDPKNNMLCRGKADFVDLKRGILLDIKSIDPRYVDREDGLTRSAWEFEWWHQTYFYKCGFEIASGQEISQVYILTCEKREDPTIRLLKLDTDLLHFVADDVRSRIDRYYHAVNNPRKKISQEIVNLTPPEWVIKRVSYGN